MIENGRRYMRRKYSKTMRDNLVSVHISQAGWNCSKDAIEINNFYDGTIVVNHTGRLLGRSGNLTCKTTVEENDFNVCDLILTALVNNHWEKLAADICANK